MKLLVITSCTGEKAVDSDQQLLWDDFKSGKAHVATREKELGDLCRKAGEMYTGEQHVRLMRGVSAFRSSGSNSDSSLALHVLSAGYGIIPEERVIAPYEVTFATMKAKEIDAWSMTLGVPEDFRRLVSQTYDLGLILLGDNYLRACQLDETVQFGGPTILFCGAGMAKKLPTLANVRVIPISNPEAKRFSCGLVGLKGELAARILTSMGRNSEQLHGLLDPKRDVLKALDSVTPTAVASSHKTNLARSKKNEPQATNTENARRAVPNPAVDFVIRLPDSWRNKEHRKRLRYFIPEWDDYVDPEYNFLTDTHWGGGAGDWSNEAYAHQIYPEPNYDGILMSRAVAEKSKKKDARINEVGVHRYVRVPRDFPIMGDCGAFDYIMQDVPPYSTSDVLDYYTRLDFDYGVSVDHLIVAATEHQKKERYDLTIQNAEDFLKEHNKAGLKWEPIGAVQGWDPASYALAAKSYVQMGYRYIALGGLVRNSTKDIFKLLQAVHEVVPKGVNVHLFGIARPEALRQFSDLGVTSVDSASHLRRAWLVARDNYFILDGDSYSSLRIPEVGKSYRAKRVLASGKSDEAKLLKLQSECLGAVREFDRGRGNVARTTKLLLEYHELISEGGPDMRVEYERTLDAQPWKQCPCHICKTWGVEVMIFRGNNRNRRRGFHNTYVFYRLMQKALNGEVLPGKDKSHPELFDLALAS